MSLCDAQSAARVLSYSDQLRAIDRDSNGSEAYFYSGRNAALKTSVLDLSPFSGEQSYTWDAFVQEQAFKTDRYLWIQAPLLAKMAQITAANSQSPLLKVNGPNAIRNLYWPYRSNVNDQGLAGLDKIRVAVNGIRSQQTISTIEKSVEIFVRDRAGRWQPYFFTSVGKGRWIPLQKINGVAVSQVCAECHLGPNGFTPRALTLQTPEDFRAVGYRDELLIRDSLRY